MIHLSKFYDYWISTGFNLTKADKCILLLIKCGFSLNELDSAQGNSYVKLYVEVLTKLQTIISNMISNG